MKGLQKEVKSVTLMNIALSENTKQEEKSFYLGGAYKHVKHVAQKR